MANKLKLTTLGLPMAGEKKFPQGCPVLKAWANGYANSAMNGAIQRSTEIVEDPEKADMVLLPSALYLYKAKPALLKVVKEKVKGSKLPAVAFNTPFEDRNPEWLTHLVQFSWYKTAGTKGVIICPAFVPEGPLVPPETKPWEPARKGPMPKIGFCGREESFLGLALWRIFPKPVTRWLAGQSRLSRVRVLRTSCRHTLRQDAIQLLEASTCIETDFVRRGKTMMHPHRIEAGARQAFLDNMRANPYALCARGDENFSWRFYEAMACGRIPVLIDSNCMLPMEDKIDWDRLIVRIKASRLDKLPETLIWKHARTTAEEFARWQEKIRETYETLLKPEMFLPSMLEHLAPDRKRN